MSTLLAFLVSGGLAVVGGIAVAGAVGASEFVVEALWQMAEIVAPLLTISSALPTYIYGLMPLFEGSPKAADYIMKATKKMLPCPASKSDQA